MAFCKNCGKQVADDAKFCNECGSQIKVEQQEKRKTVFEGEIHKCPNCGGILKSFMSHCNSCGFEIRNIKRESPVKELIKKIEKAKDVKEKNEIIANFYIPNTKEDIYDFFILAVTNLEDKNYENDDAWLVKLEQTYHKAKLSFGNTSEFEYIEKTYKAVIKRQSSHKFLKNIRRNKKVWTYGVLIGVGIIMMIIAAILLVPGMSEENTGLMFVGLFLFVGGMIVCLLPAMFSEEAAKKENKKKAQEKNKKYVNANIRCIEKGSVEILRSNCDDVVEELKNIGFKNILTKAVKKGFLDQEGTIEGISIAGNSEFDADDEFSLNSKIIIRYYSKNSKE